ncbi:hypothetical protein MCOR28_002256 [Pyricularia oryzae]|nr:hypothetical protein MCOR19_007644 [Pyricularia oryzae]KAI6276836.1 hypothetical protein MCOR26_005462 [Pyricularia oryzae]KAI6347584.1 hypothetical protein MCOR28_002256 [Pyricularia oryzae]KAI6484018.1 hypothetical protein MCOR18_004152 [Pyricularia oryzae]
MQSHGDLNNSHAARARVDFAPDPAFSGRSFAISKDADEPDIRRRYRPFLLDEADEGSDWVAQLELSTALKMVESEIISRGQPRLRILVLYGSIRNRSVSPFYRFCTLEPHLTAAQGVCVGACKSVASVLAIATNTNTHTAHFPAYYPTNALESCSVLAAMSACTTLRACHKRMMCSTHPKVQELRELSKWSDGHVWISPEQHGNLTGIFKQQIDWIPLSSGSVRPTQGRTLAIAQVSGGSQSFNAVNSLRILGRWMRMFAIPNQSSVPKAYTQFTSEAEGSRMIPSSNRDRIVDCMEELVKYTLVVRPHFDLFGDRFSEREERRVKLEAERNAAHT